MYLAKVIGNVVATKKSDTLRGYKLMVIQPVSADLQAVDQEQVAADFVGAGIGEYVLVGSGSSVRVEPKHHDVTIDLAIIGIVDSVIT